MSETSFFAGIAQAEVSIRGTPAKSPMFFRDLGFMGGVFRADLGAARAALPAGGLRPLRMPLRRALVAVHCLEYKDSDIGPYNEVSLSIALRRGWLPFMSLVQAARSLSSGAFHAYVTALPVTTEVALHGGIDYFNYPKYLADISFRETATHRVCTLRDKESLELIMEFAGRKTADPAGAARPGRPLTFHTYPEIGGRAHRAKFHINQLERGAAFLRGASLRLGPHPRAEAFRKLGIGPLVHYVYAPRCQGVLWPPEAL